MSNTTKVIFATNTVKAIKAVASAESAMKKASGGLAQSIMLDLRASNAHLKMAVAEVREVVKGSDLTSSTKEQYGKQIGAIGKAYVNSAEIPEGDLKAIYDAIRASRTEGTGKPKGKVSRGANANKPKATPKAAVSLQMDNITLAQLRAVPNQLSKQGTYSMKSKELYQAFLVQIDLDFKAKAQSAKK